MKMISQETHTRKCLKVSLKEISTGDTGCEPFNRKRNEALKTISKCDIFLVEVQKCSPLYNNHFLLGKQVFLPLKYKFIYEHVRLALVESTMRLAVTRAWLV